MVQGTSKAFRSFVKQGASTMFHYEASTFFVGFVLRLCINQVCLAVRAWGNLVAVFNNDRESSVILHSRNLGHEKPPARITALLAKASAHLMFSDCRETK